jgi:hypothetical protein
MCLPCCAHSSVHFVALGDVHIAISSGTTAFGINLLNPEALRRYRTRLACGSRYIDYHSNCVSGVL